MKIAVVGTGYVGLSLSVLLSQKNNVWAVDIDSEKVNMINHGRSPIVDDKITEYLENKTLSLVATTDGKKAYKEAEFIIIATPTNYDADKSFFDTSSIEKVIAEILEINSKAIIVIKSTVPVGYTEQLQQKHKSSSILFSPEFLREGKALYDNLYPSRIVVGTDTNNKRLETCAHIFAKLLVDGAIEKNIPVLVTNRTEAEAVKLFANAYLAMRVGFFNELDTYAEKNGLEARQIIEGMCLDPRIGQNYNNPSFGYGGYCLPKDTKQLLANYQDIPNELICAIVKANVTRKKHIADSIIRTLEYQKIKEKYVVGVYRLTMKSDSDNFRESSIQGVIEELAHYPQIEIVIHEPLIKCEQKYREYNVINDLPKFKEMSDIIVANRASVELTDVLGKVYSRDIYYCD